MSLSHVAGVNGLDSSIDEYPLTRGKTANMNIVERKGGSKSINNSSEHDHFLSRTGMVYSPDSRNNTPRNLFSAKLNVKIDDSQESSTFIKT